LNDKTGKYVQTGLTLSDVLSYQVSEMQTLLLMYHNMFVAETGQWSEERRQQCYPLPISVVKHPVKIVLFSFSDQR
jgi:hypothetical protein